MVLVTTHHLLRLSPSSAAFGLAMTSRYDTASPSTCSEVGRGRCALRVGVVAFGVVAWPLLYERIIADR